DDDLRRGEAVASRPIRRQRTGNRPRLADRRQLRGQVRRRRTECSWRPGFRGDVQEVPPRAAPRIDRSVPAGEERREERADEVYSLRSRVAAGVDAGELANLRAAEPFER